MAYQSLYYLLLVACVLGMGCGKPPHPGAPAISLQKFVPADFILVSTSGEGVLDNQIRAQQELVRADPKSLTRLEQLGWLFISKARTSFDPYYFKLAEGCAMRIEQDSPQNAAALLLRGHALQNQHRFHEAATMARQLVKLRESPLDQGLLGDCLLELGKVEEAAEAYQKMMDLKPGLQAYLRAAQVRWITADPEGALESALQAAGATHARDPETAAWVYTRLAFYQWVCGHTNQVYKSLRHALDFQPAYPPAEFLLSKWELNQNQVTEALAAAARAAKVHPTAENLWLLWDLQVGTHEPDAAQTQARLLALSGEEPRAVALYLSTLGKDPGRAIALARKEFTLRQDVFTQDAVGWALLRAGKLEESRPYLEAAFAWRTPDPRLLLHQAFWHRLNGNAKLEAEIIRLLKPMQAILHSSEQVLLGN